MSILLGNRSQKYKKFTGVRITANAPLLNLNLNYEKLRGKDKNYFSIIKSFPRIIDYFSP